MTHEVTDEREAFEAWCIKRWAGDRGALTKNQDGTYWNGHVDFAWNAWQAAVLAHLPQRGTSELRMLTLDELWQLRDRSMEMTGQYELAIQLLFARKNGLPLTAEQSADLDTFLASLAASPQAVQPMPDGGESSHRCGENSDCQRCSDRRASAASPSDGKTQEAPLQAKGKP